MKKLLAFIMAAVMLLALTACGKKNGGNDEKPNGEGLSRDARLACAASRYAGAG